MVSQHDPKNALIFAVDVFNRSWNNASGAMREGFIPGKDGTYGIAVYTTFDFALAANYARNVGYVFRLFIDQNTPIANYSHIPGETVEAKREFCLRNGWGLVYEEQFKMFLCFGYIGVPVAIPGLKQVEVLVQHRNPGPLGQVRVQRLCHLYDSMLLNDQVVPATYDQGVTNEPIS